jgi:quinol-cytochrome oxidoreductase complex cytochrome b subunit
MRLLKKNIMLRILNSYLVDSPQPANISYLWNFGSLLGTCLMLQILTGVFLAMHYQPHVDYAFLSVEHPVLILYIFLIIIYSYFLCYFILSSKLLRLSPAWVAMPAINKEANFLKFIPYPAEPEIEIRYQSID